MKIGNLSWGEPIFFCVLWLSFHFSSSPQPPFHPASTCCKILAKIFHSYRAIMRFVIEGRFSFLFYFILFFSSFSARRGEWNLIIKNRLRLVLTSKRILAIFESIFFFSLSCLPINKIVHPWNGSCSDTVLHKYWILNERFSGGTKAEQSTKVFFCFFVSKYGNMTHRHIKTVTFLSDTKWRFCILQCCR